METSDSECFESAGEEIYSDEEETKICRKVKKLNVCEKSKKTQEPDEKKKEECKIGDGEKDKVVGIETKSDDGNEETDHNSQHFNVPPTRTVCWEPGMDYQVEKDQIKDGDKTKRNEYADPPEIVQCWEEDVNTIPLKNKPKMDNKNPDISKSPPIKSEYAIPPPIEECWEDDVNAIPLKNKPKMDNKNPDTSKSPPIKSEYAIPPPIEECWENDVRPQYSKVIPDRIQIKDNKENMWENDDWSTEEDNIESEDTKQANQKKNQEDMWENNWGDFEETKKIETTKEDVNMWDDDWEPIEDIPKTDSKTNTQEEPKKETGWGSWGTWGLSSVISTATNITTQVSQSITTVLESGIGAPNPEELAKIDREIEKDLQDFNEDTQEHNKTPTAKNEDDKPILGFDLGTLVHGVTKLVETTGSKVITGGLDTLETIGKKTMEVLQENDPGLKKKRAFLKLNDDKPILSHVLREAKEKAEEENRELEKKHLIVKRPNYETLFDDHQGLVHLEALEMLSKQCDIKLSTQLDTSSREDLIEMQETMDQIKELCELPDEEDEELTMDEIKERLDTGVKELNVPITYNRLIATWNDIETWLEKIDLNTIDSKDIHQKGIESLAQLTAIAVEQFHKGGELLLVKQHRSTADEADSLVQLTISLTTLIGIISSKFSEKLNMAVENGADKKEVNELITNVFFEAANSSTYIRDAFQLLIPVLQVGACT